jgi:histidine ammonia-lyase
MTDDVVQVGSAPLTVAQLIDVSRGTSVELTDDGRDRIEAGHQRLQALLENGAPLYGLTTGCGALDARAVSAERNRNHQVNLLRSHCVGVGLPMPVDQVRAMMVSRINRLARGNSGVRLPVVQRLVELLNADLIPVVPAEGSVGCSDLAALAHMGLVLIGEGEVWVGDQRVPAELALDHADLEPLELEGRDGFAVLNGSDQSVALGTIALREAHHLIAAFEAAAAITSTALGGPDDYLDARLATARPHPGLVESTQRLRRLVERDDASKPNRGPRLREHLSSRCTSSVAGAARDAVEHARQVLEVELNSPVDNPFIAEDGWFTSNAGNSHTQHIALVMDYVGNACVGLASMSERRTYRLLDPAHNNDLPAFLIHPSVDAGLNSGLMMTQYTAAAIVARLGATMGTSASQSISTCAGTEDHVSMSAFAARRTVDVIGSATSVIAIELLAAAQAITIRETDVPAPVAEIYGHIRDAAPPVIEDRVLASDIDALAALITTGAFG